MKRANTDHHGKLTKELEDGTALGRDEYPETVIGVFDVLD